MKNEEAKAEESENKAQAPYKHKCMICKKSMILEACIIHRLETGHSNFDPYCQLTSSAKS